MWEFLIISIAALTLVIFLIVGCMTFVRKLFHFKKFKNEDTEISIIEPDLSKQVNFAYTVENEKCPVQFECLPVPVVHHYRPRIVLTEPLVNTSRQNDVCDIPRDKMFFIQELGNGWFGQVVQGEVVGIAGDNSKIPAVILSLRDDANSQDTKVFHEELLPYRILNHRNVLKYLGNSKVTSPHLNVLEYCQQGDLKSFLLKNRRELTMSSDPYIFMKFASDIASGLTCLHRYNFVHRDLACRTCLLKSDLSVVIGDYGTSEDLFKDDYLETSCGLIPLRWLPSDVVMFVDNSLCMGPVTKESNLWSLGMTLWEMYNMAAQPFEGKTNEQVLRLFREHRTFINLPQPSTSHIRDLFSVIHSCWRNVSQLTVQDISSILLALVSKMKDQTVDFDDRWTQLGNESKRQRLTDSLASDISFIVQPSLNSPPIDASKDTIISNDSNNITPTNTPLRSHLTSTPISKTNTPSYFTPVTSMTENTDSIDFVTALDGKSDTITDDLYDSRLKTEGEGHESTDDATIQTSSVPDVFVTEKLTTTSCLIVERPHLNELNQEDNKSRSVEELSIESGIVDGGEDTDCSDHGVKSTPNEAKNDPEYAFIIEEQSSLDASNMETVRPTTDYSPQNFPNKSPDVAEGIFLDEFDDTIVAGRTKLSNMSVEQNSSNNQSMGSESIYYPRSPLLLFESAGLPTIPEDEIVPSSAFDTFMRERHSSIERHSSFESVETYEWDDIIGNELIGKVHRIPATPSPVHDLQADWSVEPNDSFQLQSNVSDDISSFDIIGGNLSIYNQSQACSERFVQLTDNDHMT